MAEAFFHHCRKLIVSERSQDWWNHINILVLFYNANNFLIIELRAFLVKSSLSSRIVKSANKARLPSLYQATLLPCSSTTGSLYWSHRLKFEYIAGVSLFSVAGKHEHWPHTLYLVSLVAFIHADAFLSKLNHMLWWPPL